MTISGGHCSAIREIASDATAEAFARALSTVETIRDPLAWIWRGAFRIATAERRSARRPVIEDVPRPVVASAGT